MSKQQMVFLRITSKVVLWLPHVGMYPCYIVLDVPTHTHTNTQAYICPHTYTYGHRQTYTCSHSLCLAFCLSLIRRNYCNLSFITGLLEKHVSSPPADICSCLTPRNNSQFNKFSSSRWLPTKPCKNIKAKAFPHLQPKC